MNTMKTLTVIAIAMSALAATAGSSEAMIRGGRGYHGGGAYHGGGMYRGHGPVRGEALPPVPDRTHGDSTLRWRISRLPRTNNL